MDNKQNNWLSLAVLRRKIHKKFKRNRQKLENSQSLDEILEVEPQIEIDPVIAAPEISEQPDPTASTATSNHLNALSSKDVEDMKKELFKLSWYWPQLSRLEAQKILSNTKNGSFLVRDSSEKDSFTLSFRTNSKTFHCRNQW
jgi:hypothetical protein